MLDHLIQSWDANDFLWLEKKNNHSLSILMHTACMYGIKNCKLAFFSIFHSKLTLVREEEGFGGKDATIIQRRCSLPFIILHKALT